MKTVYEVSVSNDELPFYVIAEDPEAALAEALERARDRDVIAGAEPVTRIEGLFPDFDDFSTRFTLLRNPHDPSAGLDGCIHAKTGIEWETARAAPRECVWTLIESEDLWWIAPGIHIVNSLGFLISREPRERDEPDYLYD